MTLAIWPLLKELGPRALAHYLRYQLLLRTGAVRRRTPTYRWAERPLEWWVRRGDSTFGKPALWLDSAAKAARHLKSLQGEAELPAVEEADEILRGEFRLFGGRPRRLSFPPDWLRLPLDEAAAPRPAGGHGSPHDGARLQADLHWTKYTDGGEIDLRLLWELSRFGWTYPLGRAYRLTEQRHYADGFFELLASWRGANPPNAGPNWVSAQEAGLRVMALSFAWWAFYPVLEGDLERTALLLTTLAANAERIPPTLSYAQAQRNNHLISEAVGLYAAGMLFPQFREAMRWKATGRRQLIAALEDQVFSDGGYIQHSVNYHRLALSAGLWMARLADSNGEPLPEPARAALGRLTAALAALLDPDSGRTPNLGSNDGSNILPLSGCAHSDYRPIVQAAALAFEGRPALGNGPWDELALWLGMDPAQGAGDLAPEEGTGHAVPAAGAEAPADETRRTERWATAGDFSEAGLYLHRNPQSWGMLRCARFSSRPSQSDQLHLDLWWRGHNIARDPGSYRYTVSGLEGARAHNTLIADEQEPMRRAGRFLWVARQPAVFLGRWSSENGRVETMAAEQRLPGALLHRRSVVCAANTLWVVIDELAGSGEHEARISWLLPDWEWELRQGELLLRGGPDQLRVQIEPESARLALFRCGEQLAGDPLQEPAATVGWWAPSYGGRQPALSLVARLRGALPLRLASWWRLGEPDLGPELAEGPLAEFLGDGD